MLDVSQQNVGSICSNTPLIQPLLRDGPQYKIHLAWLVALELGILQNPGERASFTSTTEGLPTEEQLHDIKV